MVLLWNSALFLLLVYTHTCNPMCSYSQFSHHPAWITFPLLLPHTALFLPSTMVWISIIIGGMEKGREPELFLLLTTIHTTWKEKEDFYTTLSGCIPTLNTPLHCMPFLQVNCELPRQVGCTFCCRVLGSRQHDFPLPIVARHYLPDITHTFSDSKHGQEHF